MPKVKNFIRTRKQTQDSSHGGKGSVDLYEIWQSSDFKSDVDFMDRVVIPPGTTVGTHRHGSNEEMYIVLDGEGTMTIENESVAIKKGDMILNPAHGEHGLVNDSNADIELLVIQIGLQETTR